MPLPFRKKKKEKRPERKSFFSDQVIKDYSIRQCTCQLYFPEPSITFDENGHPKEMCITSDNVTLLWSKHCTVHICQIPNVPADFTLALEDTGQDCEVCLNVVLNKKNRSGVITYTIRDRGWHDCSIKSEQSVQRFVLHLDQQPAPELEQFEDRLRNILQLIEDEKDTCLTLLVVVQTKDEKRRSIVSENKNNRLSLTDLPHATSRNSLRSSSGVFTLTRSRSSTQSSAAGSFSNEGGSDNSFHSYDIDNEKEDSLGAERDLPDDGLVLIPPFEPAPYLPPSVHVERPKQKLEDTVKVDELEADIINFCDSLNIHPNELPQSFQSVLRSANFLSSNTLREKESVGSLDDRCGVFLDAPTAHNDKHFDSDMTLESEEIYMSMRGFAKHKEPSAMADQAPQPQPPPAHQAHQAVPPPPVKPDPRLQTCQNIAELLATAVNSNDPVNAQEFAKKLADESVQIAIDVKLKPITPDERNKEFSLKVNIEDKEASGGNIVLKVKATNTIRDLKNIMLIKHNFPVEVQHWIIGRRIPADTETLARCRIRDNGYTAFLYLVSAKSAGVEKDEFNRKQELLLNPVMATAGGVVPTPDVTPAGSRHGSSNTPSTAASAGAGDAAKMKFDPNIASQQEVKKYAPGPKIDVVPGLMIPPNIPVVPEHPNIAEHVPMPGRQPVEDEEPTHQGWQCPACTYINLPTRPGCEVCAYARPPDYMIPADYVVTEEEKRRLAREEMIELQTREAHMEEQRRNFQRLQQIDNTNIIPNTEEFQCAICFDDIPVGEGVVLRECLHKFCRECLRDVVKHNEQPVLTCPYTNDEYSCEAELQDREVKGLVTAKEFAKYKGRSLSTAESQAENSFHCKTADCPGWCIYEDLVNFFVCQVCGRENCLTCKAIHQGMNCVQYQDDLKIRAVNDRAANQTQIMIKKMLDDGDAMNCPQCQVIVMKKEGCDWIQCSICKTEICWVTKGPRWGRLGNGDVSGGCRCRVNGQICHPNCNNCH